MNEDELDTTLEAFVKVKRAIVGMAILFLSLFVTGVIYSSVATVIVFGYLLYRTVCFYYGYDNDIKQLCKELDDIKQGKK